MLNEMINEIVSWDYLNILIIIGFFLLLIGAVLRVAGGFVPVKFLSDSVLSCFGILFIYVLAIVVLGIGETYDNLFFGGVPFFNELSDFSSLFTVYKTNPDYFFKEIIKVFTLSFTYSFFNRLTKSKNFVVWYFLQCLFVCLSMFINSLIGILLDKYLPKIAVEWIPIIIFALLSIVLLLLIARLIFKTLAFFTNPVVGAFLSFFTDNFIGKNLISAFGVTVFFALLALIFKNAVGVTSLVAGLNSSFAFVPTVLLLIALWYICWVLLKKKV